MSKRRIPSLSASGRPERRVLTELPAEDSQHATHSSLSSEPNNSTAQIATLRAHLNELLVDARRLILKSDSQTVLHQLLGTSRFAALVANSAGVYVFANAAAAVLTGYTTPELLRLSVWELTPGVRGHEAEVLWRAFIERGEQSGEYIVLRNGGRMITTAYAARANFLPYLHLSLLGNRGSA